MPPNYGLQIQYAKPDNTAPLLNQKQMKYIQEVVGMFLYYARAVNSTMLIALSAIVMEQAKPTTTMMQHTKQFLDYATTNSKVMITYHVSNMVLVVHNDASYLSEPNMQSRARGHFFLSNNPTFPPNNGVIHTTTQIIKAVMLSAVEAELEAHYINANLWPPCVKPYMNLAPITPDANPNQ